MPSAVVVVTSANRPGTWAVFPSVSAGPGRGSSLSPRTSTRSTFTPPCSGDSK